MTNKIIGNTFPRILRTNSILRKAGGQMLKTSFQTAKKIAVLYKDAGVETYKIGKKVVQGTLRLTIDNQKEIFQTSGKALRDAADNFRQEEKPPVKAKKSTTKRKSKAKKRNSQDLKIDDLLPNK